MALRENKIISYSNNDPRYNFVIKDSIEYNTSIPPFDIKQICKKNPRSKMSSLNVSCDGQRYEHCVHDIFDDKYMLCNTTFGEKFNNNIPNKFIPKKLNNNTFYSDTWISKLANPDLEIDDRPDINGVSRSKVKKSPRNNIDKPETFNKIDRTDRVEHCVSAGIIPGGWCTGCKPCMVVCCPCLPPWLAVEDCCIICICLCILCILLPCIMSLCQLL